MLNIISFQHLKSKIDNQTLQLIQIISNYSISESCNLFLQIIKPIKGFNKLYYLKMSVSIMPTFKNQVILNCLHPEVAPFREFMKDQRVANCLECTLYAHVKVTGTLSPLFSDHQKETITALVVALHTSFRLTSKLYRIFPDIAGSHDGGETVGENGLSVYRDDAEKYFGRLKALWSGLEKMLSKKRIVEWMGGEIQDEEENYSGRWWEEVPTYLVAIDYDEIEENLSEWKVWNEEIRAWIRKPLLTWYQRYASVRLVSHR